MFRILKSELYYLKGRLILSIIVSTAPPLTMLIMAFVSGGFLNVSHVNYAMTSILGGMLFMAAAYLAMSESPEPRSRRLPGLMMTPMSGRNVWFEIILTRIIILAPAMIGILLLAWMAPEVGRGFAVFMASGFASFALLLLGLLYMHMGFKKANSPRARFIIILWDLILVGRIVVPMLFADWSTVAQPTTPPGKDINWSDVSNKMGVWEWVSWAETIITYSLCYWTFTKRQSYLSK